MTYSLTLSIHSFQGFILAVTIIMTLLCVGLEDSYPKCGQEWRDGDTSDLVNSIGKSLEKIGQLNKEQMAEVLRRAKRAGFIRWHMLATHDDQSPFDSTLGNDCSISFTFTVLVDVGECNPAVNTLMLDEKHLAGLVRRFGADLEQLRKLTRAEMHTVGITLQHVAFVNGFFVSEEKDFISASERTVTGEMQTSPSLPPESLNNPILSTHNALSTLDDHQSPRTYLGLLGDPIDFSREVSSLLPNNNPSKSTPPATQSIFICDSTSCVEVTSAVSAYPPGNGVSMRSAGSKSYPGPRESNSGSKAHSTIVPHSPLILANADEGASCYPTPPSCDEISSVGGHPIVAESGRITENKNKFFNTNTGELSASMALTHTVQNLKRLLFSCDSTLDEDRVQGILHMSAKSLIAENLEQMIQPLLSHWIFSDSLEISALGLPAQWRGIDAAANYLRILDCHEKPSILTRFGQVLLYFNYEELCREQNRLTHRTSLKADKTDILNYILEAYHDDPKFNEGEKLHRDRITGYHIRRGKWWWRIASTLGVGILLLGNTTLVHKMCGNKFTEAQVKAFVTLSLKTRPGSKGIFEATESLVKSIIFGHSTRDPHALLFNHEFGLLRPEESRRIRTEDEQALSNELSQSCWVAEDIVKKARSKMADYLGWESDK